MNVLISGAMAAVRAMSEITSRGYACIAPYSRRRARWQIDQKLHLLFQMYNTDERAMEPLFVVTVKLWGMKVIPSTSGYTVFSLASWLPGFVADELLIDELTRNSQLYD